MRWKRRPRSEPSADGEVEAETEVEEETGDAELTLADVYARIPEVHCQGLCMESCGPIAMSCEEDERLRALGVIIPSMLDSVAAVERGEDYYCPALRDGRCGVYDDRPTICRLWGATTSMPCPHGCGPAVPLTQEESHELLALSGRAGGGMAARFFTATSDETVPSDR